MKKNDAVQGNAQETDDVDRFVYLGAVSKEGGYTRDIQSKEVKDRKVMFTNIFCIKKSL